MPCFYCGKRVSLVRQMADPDFCSDEHRKRYHDVARLALRRLTDASEPAKPEAKAPRTPLVRQPAAKRPQEPPGPPVCAPVHEVEPLPAAPAAEPHATLPPSPLPGPHPGRMPGRARAVALALPVFGFLTPKGLLRRRFARPRSAAAPRLTTHAVTAMDRSWLVRAGGLSLVASVPAFPPPAQARTSPAPAFAAPLPAQLNLPELRGDPARTASLGRICDFGPLLLQPCRGPAKPAFAECVFALPAAAAPSRGDRRKTWRSGVSCPPAPLETPRPIPGPSPAPRTCDAFGPAEDLQFIVLPPSPRRVHEPPNQDFAPSLAMRLALVVAERAGAAAAPRFEIGPVAPAHGHLCRRSGTLEASAPVAEPAHAALKVAAAFRPASASFAARGVRIAWSYRPRPAAPLRPAGFQPVQEPRGTVPAAPACGQSASAAFSFAARLPESAGAQVRRDPRTAGFEPGSARAARVLAGRAIPTATWPSAIPLLPTRVDRAVIAAAGTPLAPSIPAFRVPLHEATSKPCRGLLPGEYAAILPQRPRIVLSQFHSEPRKIASRPLPPLSIPVLGRPPAVATRIEATCSDTRQPAPARRPATPAEALGARGFTVRIGLPRLGKPAVGAGLGWAGPVDVVRSAARKRSAAADTASATFSVPAPQVGAPPAASFGGNLRRPEFERIATVPARVRSTPGAGTSLVQAPIPSLPALPGTERDHVPAAAALRKVRVAAANRLATRQCDPFAAAASVVRAPVFAPPVGAHREPAALPWRTISVTAHTIPASFRTNPASGAKLQRPAVSVPAFVAGAGISRDLPVSGFQPLAGAGTVLKTSGQRGAALACSVTIGTIQAIRALRIRPAGGVRRGSAMPLPAHAADVALGTRTASASLMQGDPAAPVLPGVLLAAGLAAARFAPPAVRAAFRARESAPETWQAQTPDARLDCASTPPALATHAPVRGLLQTVRVRIVARVRTQAAPLPAQPLPAPPALLPFTPAAAARLAVAAAVRETIPSFADDARARTVAHAGVEFRPAAVTLVRCIAALPPPGYPTFTFTSFEVPDFDDDSTYAAAKPCEAALPAAVLPRGRDRRPVLIRVPIVCGWLNGHLPWPAGASPAPVPDNGVTLAIRPLMAAREAVPDEEDRVRLAAAVGEGWESPRTWKGTSRLFR